MTDPVRQLMRLLARNAADAGSDAALSHEHETPWATATFAGARHIVAARGEPVALARWLHMLPEADLPLNGHVVASCAAELTGGDALIEMLVLEA